MPHEGRQEASKLAPTSPRSITALHVRLLHYQNAVILLRAPQDVLGRKDAAIASLKAELAAVQAKLEQFQGL